MKIIWKYTLVHGHQTVTMPEGAEVLSVAMQGDRIMLWALVRPDAAPSPRRFVVIGTGWKLPEGEWRFLRTVLTDGGAFVWHVFEGVGP